MAPAKKVAKKKATKKKEVSKLPREVTVSKEVERIKVIVETPLNLKLTAQLGEYGLNDLEVLKVDDAKDSYVDYNATNGLESIATLPDAEFEDLVLAIRSLREESRKSLLLQKAKS